MQQLTEKLQKKNESIMYNTKSKILPENNSPLKQNRNYMPSRFNVTERVPTITYSNKNVLNDLENKVEKLDDNLCTINEQKIKNRSTETKNIVPIANKILIANEFKKKPLRRHENDLLLYKEIFVQPKEKILVELKEKEKNFENLIYEGTVKQYDKILNIYDEETEKNKQKMNSLKKKNDEKSKSLLKSKSDYYKNELDLQQILDKNTTLLKNDAQPVFFQEKDEKKLIERNFFDQQIQVLYLIFRYFL